MPSPISSSSQSVAEKINFIEQAAQDKDNVFVDRKGNLTRGTPFQRAVLWVKESMPNFVRKQMIGRDAWESGRTTFQAQLNYKVRKSFVDGIEREVQAMGAEDGYRKAIQDKVKRRLDKNFLAASDSGEKLKANHVEAFHTSLVGGAKQKINTHHNNLVKNAVAACIPTTALGKEFNRLLTLDAKTMADGGDFEVIRQLKEDLEEEITFLERKIARLEPEQKKIRKKLEREINRASTPANIEKLKKKYGKQYDVIMNNMEAAAHKPIIAKLLPSLERSQALDNAQERYEKHLPALKAGFEKMSKVVAHGDTLPSKVPETSI